MQTESAVDDGTHTPPPLSEYIGYCKRAFSQAIEGGFTRVRLSVPAPCAPLLSHSKASMLWCPATGSQCIGSGEMARVSGTGTERFSQIKEQAQLIWDSLCSVPHGAPPATAPRLFGGLSFTTGPQSSEWEQFGHGTFWLPRALYEVCEDKAWLSLVCTTEESPEEAASTLWKTLQTLAQAQENTPKQAQIDLAQHLDESTWRSRIESIRAAISQGKVHKIVAARSSRLHFRGEIQLRPALEKLSERYPDCFRFAFALGENTFLGASPETLLYKQGLQVRTQGIAGSIAANTPNADQVLLSSSKDRLEQDLVVQAIAHALQPICDALEYAKTPETLTLRHVTHLCTPIAGKLKANEHVLDLVEALHPTPAVGGSPTQVAMDWISQNEGDRGWYASPVGWFDAEGDGHFAVAIRSALFIGNEAFVYAGAGIVQDSDPALEYQETGLKQRAILDALGIFE